METKTAYIVWTNTDLTEGRGREYPLATCELRTTAVRLGARKYVQGSDCNITEITLYRHHGRWYGPVNVQSPTPEDEELDRIQKKKDAAIEKARALGLTEEEINLLNS